MASTSTGMGMFNTELPQFNGKNYDYWAITMKALFACQDLWEIVEDGFDEPTDENGFNSLTPAEKDLLKSNRKKDSKARVLLYLAVDQSVFPRLVAAKTSNEAWETLKTAYQGMEKVKTVKLQLLRRDFENLNMKESDNIDSFFTHVIGLVTQMRTHGETIEDRRIVEKILRVLPSKFDAIVTTIEETKDLSNFSVDELHASLITHEQRLIDGFKDYIGPSPLESDLKEVSNSMWKSMNDHWDQNLLTAEVSPKKVEILEHVGISIPQKEVQSIGVGRTSDPEFQNLI
eukprot:PITA_29791